MHSNSVEWNKRYDSTPARRAAGADRELTLREPGGFLFVLPVSSAAVLCVEIADSRAVQAVRRSLKTAIGVGLLSTGLLAGFCIAAYRSFVVRPREDLVRAIESLARAPGDSFSPLPDFRALDPVARAITECSHAWMQELGNERSAGKTSQRAAREVLRLIAGSHPLAILTADHDLRVTACNEAMRSLLPELPQAIEGKHILDILPADLFAAVQKALRSPEHSAAVMMQGRKYLCLAAGSLGEEAAGLIITVPA